MKLVTNVLWMCVVAGTSFGLSASAATIRSDRVPPISGHLRHHASGYYEIDGRICIYSGQGYWLTPIVTDVAATRIRAYQTHINGSPAESSVSTSTPEGYISGFSGYSSANYIGEVSLYLHYQTRIISRVASGYSRACMASFRTYQYDN